MKTERVVVVTGAAGGIGRLVAERFVDNGDTVIAVDRDERALGALERHPRLTTMVADITQAADCRSIADLAEEVGGRVDVLANIAGWYPGLSFEDMEAEDFRKIVDVNLTSAFLIAKACWPLMKGRNWGRVVLIGSASVYEGGPDQVHYVAAKAGVVGLARSLARVMGEEGVTVNVVTPGLTSTPPARESMPELIEEQIPTRAIKREEQPEDLVGAIYFLASPDADFISGQTINVDGGRSMP